MEKTLHLSGEAVKSLQPREIRETTGGTEEGMIRASQALHGGGCRVLFPSRGGHTEACLYKATNGSAMLCCFLKE